MYDPQNRAVDLSVEDYAYSRLLSYIRLEMPNYIIGKHHKLIAHYLQRLERGEITRLAIFMPPRHGKCVMAKTMITLADGSKKQAQNINIGDYVLSYKDGKLSKQIILGKEFTTKPSIRITSRTGRSITVSHDHPMLTFDGYKKAEDLTLEESLVTIHSEIDSTFEIDDSELDFITCMIFEGCCSKKMNNPTFTNDDPIVVDLFKKSTEAIGIKVYQTLSMKSFEYRLSVESIQFLKKYNINNHLCYTKRIPKDFFRMSIRQKWRFIDLMFQTDGYFCQSAGNGGIALANEKLIDDIQSILSTCAIASAKSYKKNDKAGAWVLTIGRSQLDKILKNCDLGNKRIQCEQILKKKNSFSLLTTFPWQLGKTIKNTRKNGFRCDNKKNISIERLERLSTVYPELDKYLNMDFIYDQVVSIENVSDQKLVHLQVSETQNFIANDFVSHNTMLASEFFSAWYLGRNPTHEIIFSSYAQDRSDDVGKAVRNLMLSEPFEAVFPGSILKTDAKGTRKFQTIKGGSFFATGWGGAITGRGASCLILDDLIKDRADSMSETNRRKREDWFTSTAYTRLMSDETSNSGKILLIMTRWAFNDIAAFLLNDLAHENWHILNCPAVAEADDILGREPGEALWPEKYPIERLNVIKQSVKTDDWASLYQQRPLPKEGGLIKLQWFQRYDQHKLRYILDLLRKHQELPEELSWFYRIIISVDTAYKASQINDPSALTVWGYDRNRQYLIDADAQRLEFPQLKTWLQKYHQKYLRYGCGPVPVLIEDAASGQSLIQVLKQETNIPVIPIYPEKSKIIRMEQASDYIESGRVLLPDRANWLTDLETELAQFPYGAHDDLCDSISQYIKWIYRPKKRKSKKKMFFK